MSIITLSMYMAMIDEARPVHWIIPISAMAFDISLILIMRLT